MSHWLRFLAEELLAIRFQTDGQVVPAQAAYPLLLPGAFNPAHDGHWGLAAAAEQLTGHEVVFELSVHNVDKPTLLPEELQRRVRQFAWRRSVVVTRASTFEQKAKLFPGATFVIGADTAQRLILPRYHGGTEAGVLHALSVIEKQSCRFLVANRNSLALADLSIPRSFLALFGEIPAAAFCLPLSSTEIRERRR